MTWGEASTESEGQWQLDNAIANGINFVDTAEMYPTNPLRRETAGKTEQIIGNWIKKRNRRDDVLIATKITGEGNKTVRDGSPISKNTISAAIEESLKRLNTDYVDLYQLHWPNRGSYHFRQNWDYDPTKQATSEIRENIYEVLGYLSEKVKEGKIRTIGLSNETAEIMLDGGSLNISWNINSNNHVIMSGPVSVSFLGDFSTLGIEK